MGQHPGAPGLSPRDRQDPLCPKPVSLPSTEGQSQAALGWHGCLTQLVTLAQWHQQLRALAAAWHSSLLPLRDTGTAHHRSLQPHTAQLSTGTRAARGPSAGTDSSMGPLHGHGPQTAQDLSGSTNLPGTTPWINQHARAIVVKHLFVQVFEAIMFTPRDLTTSNMEHDLGLQLLPPDFSS